MGNGDILAKRLTARALSSAAPVLRAMARDTHEDELPARVTADDLVMAAAVLERVAQHLVALS